MAKYKQNAVVFQDNAEGNLDKILIIEPSNENLKLYKWIQVNTWKKKQYSGLQNFKLSDGATLIWATDGHVLALARLVNPLVNKENVLFPDGFYRINILSNSLIELLFIPEKDIRFPDVELFIKDKQPTEDNAKVNVFDPTLLAQAAKGFWGVASTFCDNGQIFWIKMNNPVAYDFPDGKYSAFIMGMNPLASNSTTTPAETFLPGWRPDTEDTLETQAI